MCPIPLLIHSKKFPISEVLPPPPPAANQLVGTQEHGTKTIMGASGRFKGEPGGHGPRLCTFDNTEAAPYLRKN